MGNYLHDFRDIHLLTNEGPHSSYYDPLVMASSRLLSSRTTLDKEGVQIINNEFYARDLPSMQKELSPALQSEPPSRDILPWLSQLSKPDAQLFTAWHYQRVGQLQNHIDRDFDQLQDQACADMEELVRVGGLHSQETISRLHAGLRLIEFQAFGPLESHGIAGYYDGTIIGLANLYEDPATMEGVGGRLQSTVFHEDMHMVGDLSSLLGEFVAEHSSVVSQAIAAGHGNGYPEIICPGERTALNLPDNLRGYTLVRETIGQISKKAEIAMDLYCDAYAENTHGPAHKELYKKIGTTLDAIVGKPGSLTTLLQKFNRQTTHTQRTRLLSSILEKID